ncbi:MAG: ROK family protein [Acidimicrobiales bacterium]|nr:ROK family protein [Acidimicrobiales bacterium]
MGPTDGAVVGVDVGGTKIHTVALASDGAATVLAEDRRQTPRGTEELVAAIRDAVAAVAARPAAVGVGIAGLVDRTGVLRYGPNLPGAVDVDLLGRLADLGCAVVVENDNTCAAWAEHRVGAARGEQDVLFVGLGTGIGIGIVADGRILHGASGFAGEAGHMIVQPDGVRCVCGRSGCWERYASGAALARFAQELVAIGRGAGIVAAAGRTDEIRGEHVVAAYRSGDPDAGEVVATLARWTALGVANLVGTVDPAVVVLGGGVLDDLGEDLCRRVSALVPDYLMGAEVRPPLAVRPASLGTPAAAIGAALLAQERLRPR